jgi:hypothetical protein
MADDRWGRTRLVLGEEAWRVTKDGRTMACRLRRETAGAGWELVLTLDGQWQLGRRCPNEPLARYAAESLKQDHIRGGWSE